MSLVALKQRCKCILTPKKIPYIDEILGIDVVIKMHADRFCNVGSGIGEHIPPL